MSHPEAFLVPVLMFLDYFLTVLGSIQRDKGYSTHFKIQHYELNPIWQNTVAKKQWFNLRHTLITLMVSTTLIVATNYGVLPGELSQGILGCLIGCFGVLVGRHISNLFTFRYYIQNPDAISGQVTMSHSLVLAISTYQYITVLLPLTLIATFSGSFFAYGGVAGIGLLLFWHTVWRIKAKRQIAKV